MHKVIDNKIIANFIAINLLVSSLVAAFFTMSLMYWKVKDNNGSWSYALSAGYYGSIRVITAILVMMQFFAYVLARKYALKTLFSNLTGWLFIVAGKMVFLASLACPIVWDLYSVGRERLKYSQIFYQIFAGDGMTLSLTVVCTFVHLIIEYPIHTILRTLFSRWYSNDEQLENYYRMQRSAKPKPLTSNPESPEGKESKDEDKGRDIGESFG